MIEKLADIDFVGDGPGKPVGINRVIGRRPISIEPRKPTVTYFHIGGSLGH